MIGRSLFAACAIFALAAFIAASPQPSPSAHPSATPGVVPTRGMSAPTPSLPDTSPFGEIGKLERDRKTTPYELAPFLKSSDPAVVARAAVAIGRLRNPTGVQLLTPLLGGDQPVEVRAAAAFALGLIGSADALPALRTAATHGAPLVAGDAADSLGRIGGSAAVETLSSLVSNRDVFVRGKAAIGLGESGFASKPQISQPLRATTAKLLDNAFSVERDPEVRWRMAWAIYRSFYDTNTGLLRTMLNDQQELVRMYAVKAIGRLKDKTFLTSVRLLTSDPSWRVRVEVSNVLNAMGDHTPVDVRPPAVPADDQVEPKLVPSSEPQGDHPQVAIVTNRGVIVVELFPDVAPYHVDAFLRLVDAGFYNNSQLDRVIPNFVVQGGNPDAGKTTGSGGPGFNVPDEVNWVEQLSGMISLGLDYKDASPIYDSGGSQYYITESPQLHLDEYFTTFGRVVKGLAVVYAVMKHDPSDIKTPPD
ncbi:MAG: peptidylprolyl isomerase, partial [Candidatus Eremiobacteraeota bacterium]|nr:peptidylprolyl isomerase [Candidatus Eremiobacteraeota bacterium]